MEGREEEEERGRRDPDQKPERERRHRENPVEKTGEKNEKQREEGK